MMNKLFIICAVVIGFALLISNSIQPESNRHQLDRMLYEASGKGDIEKIKQLLSDGANIDGVHAPGNMTPLILASENSIEVVSLLIYHGANLNGQNHQGKTALIKATYAGEFEIVKMLVENGADVNIKDKFGDGALMSAIFRGNPLIVEYLVLHGAKPYETNKLGDSSLDVAKRLVAYIETMDESEKHHDHHMDNDHVVVDKDSALLDRNRIIKFLALNKY